jgi:hypothetical protein
VSRNSDTIAAFVEPIHHCMISYTTREEEVRAVKPFVDWFCDLLRARGIRPLVWYDGYYVERRLYPDRELAEILKSAVRSCWFTVSFLSPGYLFSPWCGFEVAETIRAHEERHTDPQFQLLPVFWKGPIDVSLSREHEFIRQLRRHDEFPGSLFGDEMELAESNPDGLPQLREPWWHHLQKFKCLSIERVFQGEDGLIGPTRYDQLSELFARVVGFLEHHNVQVPPKAWMPLQPHEVRGLDERLRY